MNPDSIGPQLLFNKPEHFLHGANIDGLLITIAQRDPKTFQIGEESALVQTLFASALHVLNDTNKRRQFPTSRTNFQINQVNMSSIRPLQQMMLRIIFDKVSRILELEL